MPRIEKPFIEVVPLVLFLTAVAFAAPIPEDVGKDVTDAFELPDGLQVTLWAESPQFFNPTNIDVDQRGRVWVAEAVNYRTWDGRNPGLRHDGGDRIMILEDTDGDGRCDSSKVFVQDRSLVSPVGIAVLGNKVVVSCSPSLIVYTDEDGDDRADRREIFLTGFGGFDHDHSLHAVTFGPDGRWYFSVGNAGPHRVTDQAGWTLAAGSIYTGGSPYNTRNQPGLRSDDGRVWVGGLALRIQPDGTGLTVIGHNFRNCYEIALDSFGNVWQSDNDDTVSCRTTWLMEGGNCGFASADGTRSWQADRRPGQSTPVAHWRQEDPGVIPSGDITGAGAPTGVTVYESNLLPEKFRGAVLNCDAGRNVVWAHLPTQTGAGYHLERTILLSSDLEATQNKNYKWNAKIEDRRKWFRPSDVAVSTDGAVYVADWYDSVVGGHAMNDATRTGHIYRIAPKGHQPAPPKLDLASTAGQIAALKNPAVNVRRLGWLALHAKGAQAIPALKALLADKDPSFQARAVWLLAQAGPSGLVDVEKLLGHDNPDLRIAAYRALRQAKYHVLNHAAQLVNDPSPAVRREVALSLRDVALEESRDLILQLAAQFDGHDRWALEALGTACDGKEDALYPALLEALGDQPLRWSDAFAAIAWRLHPPAAIEAFSVRALTPQLSPEQHKQAVNALAFIKNPNAARAMIDVAARGPEDIRELAQWWVNNRKTNDWKTFDVYEAADTGSYDRKDAAFVSDVIRKGGVDIDVDITGAKKISLVAAHGPKGNSFDWADWVEPRFEGPAGTKKLTELKWLRASAEWGHVYVNKNAGGKPLKVEGKSVAYGIGTHAHSEIVYAIPDKGYTRFKTKAAADDGGAARDGSQTSIEFQVYVHQTQAETESPEAGLIKTLIAADTPDDQRLETAAQLAKTPEGARRLISLASKNKLPDHVKETIAAHIFRNPDFGVRALADQYFKRPDADGTPLPPVAELVKQTGDPDRGRAVFMNEDVGCVRCHVVGDVGGQIGPELTQIGTKYAKPELFDAVLNPSATILTGYEAWVIETEDGDALTGFLLADGDTLILKDTQGSQHAIDKADVTYRAKQTLSIMPDNIALGLKQQQLVDLIAFLAAAK